MVTSNWPRSLLLGVKMKPLAPFKTGTYEFFSEAMVGCREKNGCSRNKSLFLKGEGVFHSITVNSERGQFEKEKPLQIPALKLPLRRKGRRQIDPGNDPESAPGLACGIFDVL